jgi:hypothetical protein
LRRLYPRADAHPLRPRHACAAADLPDKNIRYQQNLAGRTIAIIVLANARWPVLRLHVDHVVDAVNAATPGSYTEVDIPAG